MEGNSHLIGQNIRTRPIQSHALKKTFFNRGGLWVVGQSLLLTVAAILSVSFRDQFAPISLQLPVAVALFTLSAFTGIAGVVALGKNRTAFPTPLPDSELVSTGIYRAVRNPLYLSLILWAISWGLFWRSLVGIGFAVVITIFFDLKARDEERRLRTNHPEYAAYARRVRRFVPGIY